jgi:hypothetical protein
MTRTAAIFEGLPATSEAARPVGRAKDWATAGCLLLTAALLRWWVAPIADQLPVTYNAELIYAATMKTRQRPWSPIEESESVVRRRDYTLTGGTDYLVIQGDGHWVTNSGTVVFETLHTYGVDRRTRKHIAGYGDRDRHGQYLFPPHTEKKGYILWDPNYLGPCGVTFAGIETFHGLEVYVFNSSVNALDETEGCAALPDVPERYRALTYGKGQFRVEPVSGMVVHHVDGGSSYFVDPKTEERVGEALNQWSQHFTPETTRAQVARAVAIRRRKLALESALPLACSVTAALWVAIRARTWRGGHP